jgi:hypothetical protein
VTIDLDRGYLDQWRRDKAIALALLLAMGALGGAAAIIQGVPNTPWKGTATAIIGGVISVVTLINTGVLQDDFKTLRGRVDNGQRLLDGASRWLAEKNGAVTDDNRTEILGEVEKRLTSFGSLVGSTPIVEDRAGEHAWLSPLTAVLHAEGTVAACSCASLRADGRKDFIYGCGTGSSPSIAEAKRQATDGAFAEVARAVVPPTDRTAEVEPATLDYISRVHTDVDSCVMSSNGTYEVSVLVSVSRSLASRAAQTAFAGPSSTASTARRTPHAFGEVRVTATPAALSVPVRATPERYGDFVFTFAPHAGNPRVLDLQAVSVNQDGSAGSTPWSFTIFVNGTAVSEVPNQSYSDAQKRTVYRPVATVPLQPGGSRITILGYKN